MSLTKEQIFKRIREQPDTPRTEREISLLEESHERLILAVNEKTKRLFSAVQEMRQYNERLFSAVNEPLVRLDDWVKREIPLNMIWRILENLKRGESEELKTCLRFFGITPTKDNRYLFHQAAWRVIKQKAWRSEKIGKGIRQYFHVAVLSEKKRLWIRRQIEERQNRQKDDLDVILDERNYGDKLLFPPTPEEILRAKELFPAICSKATAKERQILEMEWIEGVDRREIPKQTKMKAGTIRVHILSLKGKIKNIS